MRPATLVAGRIRVHAVRRDPFLARPMLALIALGAAATAARAQCQLDKLTLPGAAPSDLLGRSVRALGTTVVVGASNGDGVAPDTGTVLVCEAAPGGWTPAAILAPADGVPGDNYGYTTCLVGDWLFVGAPFADSAAVDAGAVYVYLRAGGVWSFQQKLVPADLGTNDRFGFSIAIEAGTALISCHKDDDLGTDVGAFYVFELAGGVWSQTAKIHASDPKPFDDFGENVGLSGGRAIVCAWGNDDLGAQAGAIYFFERGASGWTETQKLHASDGAAGDQFGAAVAIEGALAIAAGRIHSHGGGAGGAVYVFRHDGTSWSEVAELLSAGSAPGDELGYSVALSGGSVLAGAPYVDALGVDSGAAFLFRESAGAWSQVAALVPSDGAAIDRFGLSVALDGDLAAAGALLDDDAANNAGSAYLWSADALGCPPLYAAPAALSAAAGGTQHLSLVGGPARAGDLYLLLGTTSGTSPGIAAGSHVLPLQPDGYFAFTLANPNQPPLAGSLGQLGPTGTASATFVLPAGITSGLPGLVAHHAFALLDPATLAVELTSNAEPLAFLP